MRPSEMIADHNRHAVNIETLRTFSASLPAVFGHAARAWNGRGLTCAEVKGAQLAWAKEYARSRSQWFAAQAAHEWLSREAW